MNDTPSESAEIQVKPEKKPYAAPRLTLHGTVADLTLGTKTGSTPDAESAGSFTPKLL